LSVAFAREGAGRAPNDLFGSFIDETIGIVMRQTRDTVSFAVGSPSREALDLVGADELAAAVIRRDGASALTYTVTEGEPELRDAVAQDARRGLHVEALLVDGDLEDARAVIAERRESVREGRRLRHDHVASPQEHAAEEVDALERARADEHLLRVGADAATASIVRDGLAQLGLALGDRVR